MTIRCFFGRHVWWSPYNPNGVGLPPIERRCLKCGHVEALQPGQLLPSPFFGVRLATTPRVIDPGVPLPVVTPQSTSVERMVGSYSEGAEAFEEDDDPFDETTEECDDDPEWAVPGVDDLFEHMGAAELRIQLRTEMAGSKRIVDRMIKRQVQIRDLLQRVLPELEAHKDGLWSAFTRPETCLLIEEVTAVLEGRGGRPTTGPSNQPKGA
jgi:hypothetical protein